MQEVKARSVATPADKIVYLEETRSGLVVRKTELERKISQLEERIARKRDAGVDHGAKWR